MGRTLALDGIGKFWDETGDNTAIGDFQLDEVCNQVNLAAREVAVTMRRTVSSGPRLRDQEDRVKR